MSRFGCSTCDADWTGYKIEHCTVCHQTFSGTASGDLHRTGEHGVKVGPDRRRCLSVDEMGGLRSNAGNPRLKLNDRGVWTTWSDGTNPWSAPNSPSGSAQIDEQPEALSEHGGDHSSPQKGVER